MCEGVNGYVELQLGIVQTGGTFRGAASTYRKFHWGSEELLATRRTCRIMIWSAPIIAAIRNHSTEEYEQE
jgi:hypothetical protein